MQRTLTVIPLLLLIASLLPAQGVVVHPGDANNNGTANHVDLLYVGLGFGASGPVRDSTPSINWLPQQAAFNWLLASPTGLNYAYFDCNGDGMIDVTDTTAILSNYGQLHGTVIPDSNMIISAGAPPLTLEYQQDSFVVVGDSLVMINISLGDSAQPVTDLYGIAFTVQLDPNAVDSVFAFLPGGFISGGTFTLNVSRYDDLTGILELALTRTNQLNTNGYGVIGSIGIVMDDDLRITQDFSLPATITAIHALGMGELAIGLTPQSDTLFVSTVALQAAESIAPQLKIYPQPARDYLVIRTEHARLGSVGIYDLQGKLLQQQESQQGNEMRLELADLPNGIYLLKGTADGAFFQEKITLHRN